jgi:hypothetical protein
LFLLTNMNEKRCIMGGDSASQSEVAPLNRIERSLYLGLGALLAALCLLLLYRFNHALSERAAAEATLQVKLSKAEAQALALEEELADLKGQLLAARAAQAGRGPQLLLTDSDLAALKAAGLNEPVAELIDSLQQRADLIPFPSGRFESPERWVIHSRWVIAKCTGGWLLLRYQVSDGRVAWSLLESIPDSIPE